MDVYPTLLEIAKAPKPRQVLDGQSLVPLLRDSEAKLAREAEIALATLAMMLRSASAVAASLRAAQSIDIAWTGPSSAA